jgi:nucleotide-binding universal stress UspA family protein
MSDGQACGGNPSILVATDLSAPSRHAVQRGLRMASECDGQAHVLHAMELDALDTLREMLGANLTATKAALEADARERLLQMIAEASGGALPADHAIVSVGSPLAVIAAQADARHADLLVLGARGESFLKHALLGSTAARLLRKSAGRSVLVVKQPPHEVYRNVLVTIDFSAISPALIRAARRWAPHANLVLLHAFMLPFEGKLTFAGVEDDVIREMVLRGMDEGRRRLLELADAAGLAKGSYRIRVIHGDPAQQVIAIEQECDADLIVTGKHGTHITEELLLGSVTKHVLDQSQADVLVVTR